MKTKSANPVGAHFSVAKGFLGAFEDAISIGAEAMQIFAKSPMQARLKTVTKDEATAVRSFADRGKIKYDGMFERGYTRPIDAIVTSPPFSEARRDDTDRASRTTDGRTMRRGWCTCG